MLQGKSSNYDTDVFTPLLDKIAELSGKSYGGKLDDPADIAFRAIADHARMATFSIADGAVPSNKKRGSGAAQRDPPGQPLRLPDRSG